MDIGQISQDSQSPHWAPALQSTIVLIKWIFIEKIILSVFQNIFKTGRPIQIISPFVLIAYLCFSIVRLNKD